MLHDLFGQLRARLHAPSHLVAASAHEIVAIIEEAVTLDAARVAHEWHAYLHAHPNLPDLTATTMRELHALAIVLPQRTVALGLHAHEANNSIWQDGALQRVKSLNLDACDVGEQGATIARSPYLGALRSLSLQQTGLDTEAIAHLCDATNLHDLEQLNLSHNDFGSKALELIAQTHAFHGLTHLDISNKRKIDAERSHVILSTHMAPQLVEFGINRCGLRGLTNELTHHACLRALDISSNYMNDIDLSQFIEHPNSLGLRHLDLGQNSIGDHGLLMVLNQCARLHTLHMAKTRLTEIATEHLVHSTHTHELNSLDLSRTRIHTTGTLTLTEGEFPALHSLYMDESRIEFAGLQTLLASSAFPQLRWCSLARNTRTRDYSQATALGLLHERASHSVLWHERERRQRDALTQPAMIDLSSNALNHTQISELLDTLKEHHFTHLQISDNPIGARGFEALAQSQIGARMTHLSAHATQCDERALHALCDTGKCGTLTHLRLGANRALGDTGARVLAAWEGLERLRELDLRACDLSTAGMHALLKSAHIGTHPLTLIVGMDEFDRARTILDVMAKERGVTLL